MLYVRPKITEMCLHVFSRSVHPDLLETCCCRYVERERYTLKIQITTTGHVLSIASDRLLVTEVCAGIQQPLPTAGLAFSKPMDLHHRGSVLVGEQILWSSRFSVETVEQNLLRGLQLQLAKQRDFEGLVHQFGGLGRLPAGAVSYVNLSAFRNHVALQSFHTFPETSSIVKCETRFEFL